MMFHFFKFKEINGLLYSGGECTLYIHSQSIYVSSILSFYSTKIVKYIRHGIIIPNKLSIEIESNK